MAGMKHKQPNVGAAPQIYGSSALRPYGVVVSTYKTPLQTKFLDRLRPDHPTVSHGIIITEPFVFPGNTTTIVPFDASYRAIGGVRVPPGQTGNHDEIYGSRKFGERHGDGVGGLRSRGDRYDQSHGIGHMDVFIPEHTIIDPEDSLLVPQNGVVDAIEHECALACLNTEFLCSRSCMCILKSTQCNGDIDCEDGEDEENCNVTNEDIIKGMRTECESTENHVMCPRTFTCIAKDWLCDGDDDCGDYSDETRCGAHVNCSEDQFECLNGLCIPQPWVCDGDNDCKDFSDELNCTKLS